MSYTPVELQGPEADEARVRTQSRLLAAAVAVLLVLGVLGVAVVDPVGAGPTGGAAVAAVLAAADKTSAVSTARMSSTTQTSFPGAPAAGGLTMDGVVDFAGRRMALTMTLGGLATVETRLAGSVVYIKVPRFGAGPGSAVKTPWVAIDLGKLPPNSPVSGLTGPTLGTGGDPAHVLKALRTSGLVRSAARSGQADVRGARTDVYRVVLDGQKFVDAVVGGPGAGGLVRLDSPSLEVYVDGDGLVRRQVLRMQAHMGNRGDGTHVTVVATTDLYDFGLPVDVQPPPADQVTRIDSPDQLNVLLSGGH
ncbi:MAG: hypothetical protein QOK43_2695 [Acidimicrobiaceae bacterium]|nr:hypothetical protein [Acidimicrobiaceae bacterium]